MASIRRQSRVRYYDTHGATCPQSQATTKVIEKSKIFYGFNVIPNSRRPIPLAKTRVESVKMLARIVAGVETFKTKTLENHLINWAAALNISGITQARQKEIVAKVKRILLAANVMEKKTINAEQVRTVFTRWNQEKTRWSAQTKSHYLKDLNQFLRHAGLPVIRISLPLIRINKTFYRGALTIKQAGRLITTTAASTNTFRGLTGARRALLYRLILTTGLRRKEAMVLTHTHLRGAQILLGGAETKNRYAADIDLGPSLTAKLATIKGTLFPGSWHDRSAVMVRKDAAAANITTTFRLDLHSLRHTYITWCASKFRIEITQKLARHSTSVITLDYYTHARNDDINAAAASLENDLNRCAKRCAM